MLGGTNDNLDTATVVSLKNILLSELVHDAPPLPYGHQAGLLGATPASSPHVNNFRSDAMSRFTV